MSANRYTAFDVVSFERFGEQKFGYVLSTPDPNNLWKAYSVWVPEFTKAIKTVPLLFREWHCAEHCLKLELPWQQWDQWQEALAIYATQKGKEQL